MKPKKMRRLFMAGVGLALASAGYLVFRPQQTLPTNNLYVERQARVEKEQFEQWIRGELKLKDVGSLEETIESLGYTHMRSNVASLKDAQLICLGEIHRLCGNEQSSIFGDELVGHLDKILVERSSPFEIDFPAMKRELDRKEEECKNLENNFDKSLLPSLDLPLDANDPLAGLIPILQRSASLMEGIEKETSSTQAYFRSLHKSFTYLQLRDGNEQSFLSVLASRGKGIVIGVDASRKIRNTHLYSAVEQICLQMHSAALEANKKAHPFLEWVAYEAAGVCPRSTPTAAKIQRIHEYMKNIPSFEECMRRRDAAIRENTLREVKSNTGGRSWLILGAAHLNGELFSTLEKSLITYVAFKPVEEKVAADSEPASLISSGKLGEKHGKEYIEEEIFPWYVEEKVRDGKPPYRGSFEGILPE